MGIASIALILNGNLNALLFFLKIEFDEKEMRREIMYAIKNIHGIRFVFGTYSWKVLLDVCRCMEDVTILCGFSLEMKSQMQICFLCIKWFSELFFFCTH